MSALPELPSCPAFRRKSGNGPYVIAEIGGKEKTLPLSSIVRIYPANDLGFWDKLGVYFSRWAEFLTEEPREANTEGGVMPAIFGTFAMTMLMVIVVFMIGPDHPPTADDEAPLGPVVDSARITPSFPCRSSRCHA